MANNDFSLFKSYPDIPWMYPQGLMCMIFLVLGGLFWAYEDKIGAIFKNKVLFGVIVLSYVCLIFLFPDIFKVTISIKKLNVLGVLISFVGTLILIKISKEIKKCGYLSYIGKHSIGFYFLSGAVPNLVSRLGQKIFGITVIGFFCCFLVGIVFSFLVVVALNYYFPFVFDARYLFKKSYKGK